MPCDPEIASEALTEGIVEARGRLAAGLPVVEFDSMVPKSGPGRLRPDRGASGLVGTRQDIGKSREDHVTFGASEVAARSSTPLRGIPASGW